MTETSLFLAIIVVLTIVLVAVIGLPAPRRGALVVQAEALVRDSAVAGIAALTTALMYLVQAQAGSVPALAVGDGTMVLAGWMVWAALSAVNGRGRVVPVAAVLAAATSTTVSLLVPDTEATSFKLVLVGIGCLGLGVESLRGRVRATTVYGVFTGVGFGYGGYVLLRVAVITFLGVDSLIAKRGFDTVAASLISVLAIAATAAGVVLLVGRLAPRQTATSTTSMATSIALQVLSHGRTVSVYRLEIADLALIRRARGTATAQSLQEGLVEAASARFPSGVLAVPPSRGGLIVVDAERRGAPSAAPDLVAAFDAVVERAGNADLAEVEVERFTVRTPDELDQVLAPYGIAAARPAW